MRVIREMREDGIEHNPRLENTISTTTTVEPFVVSVMVVEWVNVRCDIVDCRCIHAAMRSYPSIGTHIVMLIPCCNVHPVHVRLHFIRVFGFPAPDSLG